MKREDKRKRVVEDRDVLGYSWDQQRCCTLEREDVDITDDYQEEICCFAH